jgi:hypothetical protein
VHKRERDNRRKARRSLGRTETDAVVKKRRRGGAKQQKYAAI